jgi:hypothetical protein
MSSVLPAENEDDTPQESFSASSQTEATELADIYTGFRRNAESYSVSINSRASSLGKVGGLPNGLPDVTGDSLWRVHFGDVHLKWTGTDDLSGVSIVDSTIRDFDVLIDPVTGRLIKAVSGYNGPLTRDGDGPWSRLRTIDGPGSVRFDVGIPQDPPAPPLLDLLSVLRYSNSAEAAEIEAYSVYVVWTGSGERPTEMPDDSVPCWWVVTKGYRDIVVDQEGYLVDVADPFACYKIVQMMPNGEFRGQSAIVRRVN